MRFLIYLLMCFILVGCSVKQGEIKRCEDPNKPSWLNGAYVGMSRITASGNISEQKMIALQRAVTPLLMSKGIAKGNSIISSNKKFILKNQKEILTKKFDETIDAKIEFQDIFYDIRVTDVYKDPCTKNLYVRIEEKR